MLSFIFFGLFIISIIIALFTVSSYRISSSTPIAVVFILFILNIFLVTQISNREVVTYKDCVEEVQVISFYPDDKRVKFFYINKERLMEEKYIPKSKLLFEQYDGNEMILKKYKTEISSSNKIIYIPLIKEKYHYILYIPKRL